jgi:carbonic anhydrase
VTQLWGTDSRGKVTDQNARDAAAMLSDRSEVLRDLVREGKLKIVSAMHDVGTGQIKWFT